MKNEIRRCAFAYDHLLLTMVEWMIAGLLVGVCMEQAFEFVRSPHTYYIGIHTCGSDTIGLPFFFLLGMFGGIATLIPLMFKSSIVFYLLYSPTQEGIEKAKERLISHYYFIATANAAEADREGERAALDKIEEIEEMVYA